MIKKIITLIIVFCLLFEQAGFSQVVGPIVLPSAITGFMAADKFRPIHLRSVSLDDREDDFHIILDKGDLKNPTPQDLKDSARSLLRYFFIGLNLPNESFWVNLRPDSPDNIIDDHLAMTDMGRIMLEADVQLKKDTAKYTSPNSAEGRQYWEKLYQKAEELFGNQNISIPTLTRPWIVPDEIILRQTGNNAYIYKATLKVMLEVDYLKNSDKTIPADERLRILNEYSSRLIRELVLPKLTKDVNISQRYAALRQVYFSLILAQWFKSKHENNPAWKIDSKDLTNLVSGNKWDKDTYFKEYRKSFQDGEYNIRENSQTPYGPTIRQYFSGGIKFEAAGLISANHMTAVGGDPAIKILPQNTLAAEVKLGPANQYQIENIGMGASRSGDHPSVGGSSPGAPVLKDGGDKIKIKEIVIRPMAAEITWSDKFSLPTGVRKHIQDVVSWSRLPHAGKGRSGLIFLGKPVKFKFAGQKVTVRAIKIKGMGDFDKDIPQQPKPEIYETTASFHVVSDEKGNIFPVKPEPTPQGGLSFLRAQNEFKVLENIWEKRIVQVNIPLGFGSYPDSSFNGDKLGFVVEGVLDREDIRFGEVLGGTDLVTQEGQYTFVLKEEVKRLIGGKTGQSIEPSKLIDYLCECYRKWGEALRKLNDSGILHLRTHSGNWSVTPDNKLVIHDFDSAATSNQFTPQALFMMRLYPELAGAIRDINADCNYSPLGMLMLHQGANPYRMFLQGYFGKDFYDSHPGLEELSTDLADLKRPSKEGFSAQRFKVTQLAAFDLFEPLSEIMGINPGITQIEWGHRLNGLEKALIDFQENALGVKAQKKDIVEAGKDVLAGITSFFRKKTETSPPVESDESGRKDGGEQLQGKTEFTSDDLFSLALREASDGYPMGQFRRMAGVVNSMAEAGKDKATLANLAGKLEGVLSGRYPDESLAKDYIVLYKVLATAGLDGWADGIFEEILRLFQKIDNDFERLNVSDLLVEALLRAGHKEEVSRVYDSILEVGLRDKWGFIDDKLIMSRAAALAAMGRTDISRGVMVGIKSHRLDLKAEVLARVARMLVLSGDIEQGKQVCAEALEVARQRGDFQAKVGVFVDCAEIYAEAKMFKEAESLCQDVYLLQLDSYVDEGYVVRIGKIYARMGKTGKALGLLGSVYNQGPNKELLLSIASELLKKDNIKEALPLLRELDFRQPEGLAMLAKAVRGSGNSVTLPADFFGRESTKGIINGLLQKFGGWLIDSRFLAKLVAIGLSRQDIAKINRDIEALPLAERSAYRKEIVTLAEELALSGIASKESKEILQRVIYSLFPVPSAEKIKFSASLRRTIALMRQAKVPVSRESYPQRPLGQILNELTYDQNRREGLTDNLNLIIPRLSAANLPPEFIAHLLWYIANRHPIFFKENISKPRSFTRLVEVADALHRRFGIPIDDAAESLCNLLFVRDGLDAAYNVITGAEKAGIDQDQLKEMLDFLPYLTRTDQEKAMIILLSKEDEGPAFLRRVAFVNRARGSEFSAHSIVTQSENRELFFSLADPAIINLIEAISDVPLKKDNKYAINFVEDAVRKKLSAQQCAMLLQLINMMKETNVPPELIMPVMSWQIMSDGLQETRLNQMLQILPLLDEATKKQAVFITVQLGDKDSSEPFIERLTAAKGNIYKLLADMLENPLSPDQPAHARMLGLLQDLFDLRGTFTPDENVMRLFLKTFSGERRDEARDLLLAEIISDWIAHNMSGDTPELQEAVLAVKAGHMDPDNRMHQLANYRILRFEGSRNYISREFNFKDYLEMLDKARKGEALEKDQRGISEEEERNVRGLVYEASEIREKVIMPLALQAQKDNRKLVVVGNLSYGGVALAPITEEKNGDTFIAGTDIPVWYTKVGSTESHNDELVFVKKLFTDDQLRLLAEENPYVVVVDASTSVSDLQRTSPHIPDGFKGYRNFFMALDQALFNALHPEDFYEDQEFAQKLLDAPGVKELISRLQAMNIRPRAPNPFKFRFWYERNESENKKGALYLRVNKKKDIKAPKVDISTINSPTCVFVQSAIHPEDVDPLVKNEFIKGDYTPGNFDDKDHFRKFYLGYEEGFGLVASRQFVNLSRRLFRKYREWEGAEMVAPAKSVGISRGADTIVLDLDGTIAKLDKKPSPAMVRMINSLIKSGKDIVIITEDIEANVDARLADIDKIPGLTIFSDSGAKGYSYDATGNKVYFQEYNEKSRLPEGLREKVLAQAASFQPGITWEEETRAHRTSPDYRIEFRDVSNGKAFIGLLRTVLTQLGVSDAEVYLVSRTKVKIVLQHKERAIQYFLERKPQDKSRILIIADAVRSHQPDRKMLTAFPEAINVNVGSYSPTISRENPNIIQCDKAGIIATEQFLFQLAHSNKIPASLLNGSEKNGRVSNDLGESASRKDGGAVQEILRQNLDSIAWGEPNAFGTVADAKKAWKIFIQKDHGEVGPLSREFARQVADIRELESRKIEEQEIIEELNEEYSAYKKRDFFIFIGKQGEVQGVLNMRSLESDKADLDMLWVIPELQRAGIGIGTTLLDTFFRIVDERDSAETLIHAVPGSEDFYKKYLERKGLTPQDYEFRKAIYLGFNFSIPYKSIKKIAGSLSPNNNPQAEGGIAIVAHRGASVVEPENTLAAFERAIKMGADELEFDVQLTRDGEIVVMHDTTLEKLFGDKRFVSDVDFSELRKFEIASESGTQRIPTLKEIIETVNGRVGLQIEIKQLEDRDTGITGKLVDVLEKEGLADKVLITSFNPKYLVEVKKLNKRVRTGLLTRGQSPKDALRIGRDAELSTLIFHIDEITPELIEMVKQNNFSIGAWGIGNDRDKMKKALLIGLDRATFNEPDIAKTANGRLDGGTIAPGGIDLRRLPVNVHQGRFSPASGRTALENDHELDDEWQEIQDLVNKGFQPATNRISEYLQTCRQSRKVPAQTARVLTCIADIFRLEEDNCQPTDPALKHLLLLLDQ